MTQIFQLVGLILLIMTSAVSAQTIAADAENGDSIRGERLFLRCKACHTLTQSGRQRLGPSLAGLFSRSVGTLDGYSYSKALKEADFIWTEAALNTWLEEPNAFLPGNRMAFTGFKKPQDRLDLIAFLKQATHP